MWRITMCWSLESLIEERQKVSLENLKLKSCFEEKDSNSFILSEDVEDFPENNYFTLKIGKLGYGRTRHFLCLKPLDGLFESVY